MLKQSLDSAPWTSQVVLAVMQVVANLSAVSLARGDIWEFPIILNLRMWILMEHLYRYIVTSQKVVCSQYLFVRCQAGQSCCASSGPSRTRNWQKMRRPVPSQTAQKYLEFEGLKHVLSMSQLILTVLTVDQFLFWSFLHPLIGCLVRQWHGRDCNILSC